MLNEPNQAIPTATLQKYYTDTYNRVRAHSDCILVHAPILQTQQYEGAPGNWESFMPPPQYTNVWHTWHLYYAYNGDASSAVSTAAPADGTKISQWTGNWLLIGEWSLATHTSATTAQVHLLALGLTFPYTIEDCKVGFCEQLQNFIASAIPGALSAERSCLGYSLGSIDSQ